MTPAISANEARERPNADGTRRTVRDSQVAPRKSAQPAAMLAQQTSIQASTRSTRIFSLISGTAGTMNGSVNRSPAAHADPRRTPCDPNRRAAAFTGYGASRSSTAVREGDMTRTMVSRQRLIAAAIVSCSDTICT